MKEKCDDHGSMIDARNDIRWIKRLGWAVFTVALAVLGLGIHTIYGAGQLTERLNTHIMQNDRDLERLRMQTIELHRLYQNYIIRGSKQSAQDLTRKIDEIEKEKKPIVAKLDGEDT